MGDGHEGHAARKKDEGEELRVHHTGVRAHGHTILLQVLGAALLIGYTLTGTQGTVYKACRKSLTAFPVKRACTAQPSRLLKALTCGNTQRQTCSSSVGERTVILQRMLRKGLPNGKAGHKVEKDCERLPRRASLDAMDLGRNLHTVRTAKA